LTIEVILTDNDDESSRTVALFSFIELYLIIGSAKTGLKLNRISKSEKK